jgi:hypothetical protein
VTELLAASAVAGFFAAALGGCVALAVRIRRRRLGGGLLGPLDEAWHPAAHRYRLEIEAHEERMLPVAPADDPGPGRG